MVYGHNRSMKRDQKKNTQSDLKKNLGKTSLDVSPPEKSGLFFESFIDPLKLLVFSEIPIGVVQVTSVYKQKHRNQYFEFYTLGEHVFLCQ